MTTITDRPFSDLDLCTKASRPREAFACAGFHPTIQAEPSSRSPLHRRARVWLFAPGEYLPRERVSMLFPIRSTPEKAFSFPDLHEEQQR